MDNNNKVSFNLDDLVAGAIYVIGILGLLGGVFVIILSLFSRNDNYTVGFTVGLSVLFGSLFMLGFSILVRAAVKYLSQGEEQKQ